MAVKATSAIVNEIYPMITESLAKNSAAYRRNTSLFFEARSKEIHDIAPFTRIYFGQEDIDKFFKSLKLTEDQIKEKLTHTYYWNMNFNPRAAKDPYTVAMMMVIRHYLLHNDRKVAEISAICLAFSGQFYPSIHYGKFPKVQPSENRQVMEYVVNNMLSQKFDLKREGSVFGAVRSICITWLNTYEKIFKSKLDDEENADLIQQLHGRLKSFMGNIASLYYEAYENKDKYFTYDSDSNDEENFRVADTDSLRADRYVENTMNLITSSDVHADLCKMAADQNVRVTEVYSIIESIQSDSTNIPEIKELLGLMISEYMMNSKDKDITSLAFISDAVKPKPNTKNKNVLREKEIVEHWLDENSPQYRKRKSRNSTKTSYFRSVMAYYALLVNKANK